MVIGGDIFGPDEVQEILEPFINRPFELGILPPRILHNTLRLAAYASMNGLGESWRETRDRYHTPGAICFLRFSCFSLSVWLKTLSLRYSILVAL